MAETLNTRVKRLEHFMAQLARTQIEDRRAIKRHAERMRKMEVESKAVRRELVVMGRELDERILKLVSAIGEFIRRNGKASA